jgi:hypothetical protein
VCLRVALTGRDIHAAHRVFDASSRGWLSITTVAGMVAVTASVPMHHVGAAAETHHEVEQRGE